MVKNTLSTKGPSEITRHCSRVLERFILKFKSSPTLDLGNNVLFYILGNIVYCRYVYLSIHVSGCILSICWAFKGDRSKSSRFVGFTIFQRTSTIRPYLPNTASRAFSLVSVLRPPIKSFPGRSASTIFPLWLKSVGKKKKVTLPKKKFKFTQCYVSGLIFCLLKSLT